MTSETEDKPAFPTVDDVLANASFNAQRVVSNLSGPPQGINVEGCIQLLNHASNVLAMLRPLMAANAEQAQSEARAN